MEHGQRSLDFARIRLHSTRLQAAQGIGSMPDQFFHRKRVRVNSANLKRGLGLENHRSALEEEQPVSRDLEGEITALRLELTTQGDLLEKARNSSYIRVMQDKARERIEARAIRSAEAEQNSFHNRFKRGLERVANTVEGVLASYSEVYENSLNYPNALGGLPTRNPNNPV